MKVFLMGAAVPETPEFMVPGFVRSGNMAMQGVSEGLHCTGVDLTCYGLQPMQAFPRFNRLFAWPLRVTFPSGLKVRYIPALNILMVREVMRGIYAFAAVLRWSLQSRKASRCILMYNLYNPPFGFLLAAARLCRCPIIPIVFDIGMPPHSMGRLRDWIYRRLESRMHRYLSRADGRCVIVKSIVDRYAPGRHALLLDGGVSPAILSHLFPLEPRAEAYGDPVVLVCAGSFHPHNGAGLVLQMMRLNRDPRLRVRFAGSGPDVAAIKSFASEDSRVTYEGMLDLDGLFRCYREADVILNIRLTQALDTSTWFPSKVIEALAVGRLVLTTDVAHLRSVYGEYCLILDRETPEALSALVDEIIAMPRAERDAIGRSAREFMLREHTWDHQMKRVVRYCEGICAGEYDNVHGLVDL